MSRSRRDPRKAGLRRKRVLQHLGELYLEIGREQEAAAAFERMLELNPRDNQGVRDVLLGLYLAMNQPEPVESIFKRYPGEDRYSGMFAWARVFQRWLAGDEAAAALVLEHAREVNRYAERYLSGERQTPLPTPQGYSPGQDSEAQVIAALLDAACARHPGFGAWLRKQARSGSVHAG
jgi:tetratricopeptide (TPR) repeat protein